MLLFRRIVKFGSKQKNLLNDAAKLSEEEISKILFKDSSPPEQQIIEQTKQEEIEDLYMQKDINELLNKIQQKSQQVIVQKEEVKTPAQEIRKEKYGLPIPNIGLDLSVEERELPKTPTIRLFEVLQLNKHTSYQEYENAVANFKKGMYGEIRSHNDVRRDMRDIMKENAIPYQLIHNQKYMAEVRENRTINFSMPGTIENEHPHRFLELRPVEEFRHTPLIPIADKTMREWNEKLQSYHRKGMYLEITREQIYSSFFFALIAYIMFQMFRWILKKEEESGLQFQRLKFRRMGLAYEVV